MTFALQTVLPCYNEAPNIRAIAERAVESAIKAGFSKDTFQLVMVNNGSTDASALVFDELLKSAIGPWIKVVSVPRNQGYGFGIYEGLKSTTAPVISWTHADLQCDPEDVFKAYSMLRNLDTLQGSNCIVKGIRFGRNRRDRFVSGVFSLFGSIFLGLKGGEINAQPKVFPRTLMNFIEEPPSSFAFDLFVLYRAQKSDFQIHGLDVNFPPRIHGISKWAGTFWGRHKTIIGIIRYIVSLAIREGRI